LVCFLPQVCSHGFAIRFRDNRIENSQMYLKIKELCLILVIHAIIDVATQYLPRLLFGKKC
jgi:hypothetical protein